MIQKQNKQKSWIKKLTYSVGFFVFVTTFNFLLSALNLFAAPDQELTYHGKLTDTSNVAVADGNLDFTLTIYDSASGGACLWSARGTCGAPTSKPVTIENGIFSAVLGEAGDNVLNIAFDANYYLDVKIGVNSSMSPRRKITPTGFALNSHRLNGLTADNYIDTTATNQIKLGGLSLGDDFTVNTDNFHIDTVNGRVGIGTASPDQDLHIDGNVRLTGNFYDENNEVGTPGQILSTTATGTDWIDASTGGTPAGNTGALQFNDAGAFGADDTNLFWDNVNNRLGIGTNTPSAKLSIFGADNGMRLSYDGSNYTDLSVNSSGEFLINATNATESAMIIGSGASQDTSIQFDGSTHDFFSGIDETTGSYAIGSGSTVASSVVETGPGTVSNTAGGTTVTGTNTQFTSTFRVGNQIIIGADTVTVSAIASDTSMTTDAVATANTDVSYTYNAGTVLTVESSGNVGIGTDNPLYALDVRATGTSSVIARFNNDSTNTSCTLTANGGTLNCSSDRKLKKNILTIEGGLETFMKLEPRQYNWKTEGDEVLPTYGFIAQDVQEILPQLVREDEETGYLQLSTIGMIPLIAQAIQEQQGQIEAQGVKIESNILKTDSNIQTLAELQTSVDENLTLINQTLVTLGTEQGEISSNQDDNISTNTENIQTNTESLATLSDNINTLTTTITTLTDTALNHENRIALLESILVDQGIELDENIEINSPQIPNLSAQGGPDSVWQAFSGNLTVIQEEDIDEDGNVIPKQIFSLSGDLIVERLKAKKIVADEIEVAGVTTTNALKVTTTSTEDGYNSSSVGSVVVLAGEVSAIVETTAIKAGSRIILTPKKPVAVASGGIIENESFEVNIGEPLEDDLAVDWIVIDTGE